MAELPARIQLCGRVCIEIGGERRDARLPGPQGRRLFCYLTIHRFAALTRPDLYTALWGEELPAVPDAALSALLSRLRTALRPVTFDGLRLAWPAGTWVDLEAARDATELATAERSARDLVMRAPFREAATGS